MNRLAWSGGVVARRRRPDGAVVQDRNTPPGQEGRGLVCRQKNKGQRAVALCPFTTAFGQFLVSKLIRDVALFVHLAKRALCLDSVVSSLAQEAGRPRPRLTEHLRIFDRHVVPEFISNTCEFLDDMHAAGVEETPASQPRRIDEINGVNDACIPFPGSYAVPVVRCQARRPWVSLATICGNVAEFGGSATVIGIRSIEEDDVFIVLDDPPGRPVPWESQRLARHDWIVFVRPLIEFLNLVPELGFVSGKTPDAKPRGREPLIVHPEVVLSGFAADLGVDSRTRHLRWTASAGSATGDWIRRATPVSRQVRLPIGSPRRCDGCNRRRGVVEGQRPV